jgi:hypothetical protein
VSIADFVSSWLAARNRAIDAGERIRGRFSALVGDVFWAIEDYVEDPSARGPYQISGEELIARVRAALIELRALDRRAAPG